MRPSDLLPALLAGGRGPWLRKSLEREVEAHFDFMEALHALRPVTRPPPRYACITAFEDLATWLLHAGFHLMESDP